MIDTQCLAQALYVLNAKMCPVAVIFTLKRLANKVFSNSLLCHPGSLVRQSVSCYISVSMPTTQNIGALPKNSENLWSP